MLEKRQQAMNLKRRGKYVMRKVIVAFTSFPKRIGTVNKILDSLVQQTIMPDKIVLYLSLSEFRDFENMPNFKEYKKYGFEIHWYEENLKSHKKWFYAFQEYPNDIIITIDDDILYKTTMIETLLKYHKLFPRAVIARRTHLIVCNQDGAIAAYNEWYGNCDVYVGIPRMDLFPTGNGGILYPPNVFSQEVLNKTAFMEKCRYADDIWLKIMEVYSGIPVVLAEKSWEDQVLLEYQTNCLFEDYNKNGGNDKQFKGLIEYYYGTVGEEAFLNRLFEQGRTYSFEIKEMKERQMEKVIDKLASKLQCHKEILIYGAGLVGKKVHRLLIQYDKSQIIKAFIVNDVRGNPEKIDNVPVRNYRELLDGDEKIVIALYNKDESESVRCELIKSGVEDDRIILLDTAEKIALMDKIEIPFSSSAYWEKRYLEGGNSGAGSYNRLADFKAQVLNEFVKENNIKEVMEWGCGDGNQLSLAHYPYYVGYDVSAKAVELCKTRFETDNTKKFIWCGDSKFKNELVVELVLSLDVIYHLVEDDVYEQYMQRLFESSNKYVCIYASNFDKQTAVHVKHRCFTKWVEANLNHKWKLDKVIKNPYPYSEEDTDSTTVSDFYFYKKVEKE